MISNHNDPSDYLSRPLLGMVSNNIETLLIAIILVLTIVSRFFMLGMRDMSHDEVNHVVPSWELYTGKGYIHTPVTHGPFQFHIVALFYFLFGDNDFTSRVPAALFSTAAVGFVLFAFRRYLGRTGTLLAGLFFMISPYMMFYGRYTRNEGFIELFGVVMLYALLRYMEKGDVLSLFLLTGSIVMHFVSKETAFIYMAQLLVFLMILFINEIYRTSQHGAIRFRRFISLTFAAMFLVFIAIGMSYIAAKTVPGAVAPEPAADAAGGLSGSAHAVVESLLILVALGLGGTGMAGLIKDLGWKNLRQLRSFSMLILTGTLILPQLTAFPVNMVGWDPLDYSTVGLLHTSIFLILFFVISAVIGILWNRRLWLQNSLFFYGTYIFFYTTMFTNGNGFFTGIVGSLGYWLSQQGVNRGSQPLYYFALLQMPVYEYLAVFGTILALYFALRHDRFYHLPGRAPAEGRPAAELPFKITEDAEGIHDLSTSKQADPMVDGAPVSPVLTHLDLKSFYAGERPLPVIALLIFWAFTSLVAYSLAGEKMPWLTVHISLGFLLAAGWGIGYLIDSTAWKQIANRSGIVALCLLPIFFTSAAGFSSGLFSANPPFMGNTLDQLQATSRFIFSAICLFSSGIGIFYQLRKWQSGQVLRLFTLIFTFILVVLTARTAYRASFINYDNATEYLVYAHGAPGPKEVLAQIEEISQRTTYGKDLVVAYSGDALYPYWWYLRDYPNHRWFGDKPTKDLKDVPVIIAGDDVSSKMAPIVGDNYTKIETIRLWWPNESYKSISWASINAERKPEVMSIPMSLSEYLSGVWRHIQPFFTDAQMREAIWKIWLNRDYSQFAKLTNNNTLTLENWQPSQHMVVYIRKDIIAQIWNYGAAPTVVNETKTDPYQAKMIQANADMVFGQNGSNPGDFNAPRGLTVAADGSIFIADSRNHRIQHFSAGGKLINAWGSFADISSGKAPGGTFNEPWDVAVSKDGLIYVTDTWNHRIQEFKADGTFIRMWGYFGQGEKPEAFWGPRGLAVDQDGRVYVTDTGNKRVVIFNADGTFFAQFGAAGADIGQFDEPVGIAVDADGLVYVADTWNQRIQVFQRDHTTNAYTPVHQWNYTGWDGQSLDNKPLMSISPVNGHLFFVDPEKFRVMEFNSDGTYIRGFGGYSTGPDGFGLASGVTVDSDGGVWISDGGNDRLMHFVLQK